jgi:GT2 family glycosyltransferase
LIDFPSVPRFAVILTHNRPELLKQSLAAIRPQVDATVIIDNASDPPVVVDGNLCEMSGSAVHLLQVPTQPPNLSLLWLRGMACAMEGSAKFCAFLCDDAIAPPGWFEAVTDAMVGTGAVAGCTSAFGYRDGRVVKKAPDGDLMHRLVGWAFVLDLDSPVMPDPAMAWWWGDTDIDWQARTAGGMVNLGAGPDFVVPNLRPNDFTTTVPGLGEQVGRDRAAFAAKYGSVPW